MAPTNPNTTTKNRFSRRNAGVAVALTPVVALALAFAHPPLIILKLYQDPSRTYRSGLITHVQEVDAGFCVGNEIPMN